MYFSVLSFIKIINSGETSDASNIGAKIYKLSFIIIITLLLLFESSWFILLSNVMIETAFMMPKRNINTANTIQINNNICVSIYYYKIYYFLKYMSFYILGA
jgi:hypothetical protein